jgi:transcriptional regulator with XRE-family HTH domain
MATLADWKRTKTAVKAELEKKGWTQKRLCEELSQNEGDLSSWINGKRANDALTQRLASWLAKQQQRQKSVDQVKKAVATQDRNKNKVKPVAVAVKQEETKKKKEDSSNSKITASYHPKPGYLYILSFSSRQGEHKIGRSSNPEQRQKAAATFDPSAVLEFTLRVSDQVAAELLAHKNIKGYQIKGSEVFRCPFETAVQACLTARNQVSSLGKTEKN